MRKNVLIFGHDYTTQFVDIFNQYTCFFPKEAYAVTVVYLTGEPNEAVQHRTMAEKVVFLNLPKKSVRGLKIKAIRQLLALTREQQFEIVICHRYKPTYIMMWVARFYKIPTLIAVMHELGTMSSYKRRLLIAGLAPKNMLFAGVSNAVRDDLRNDLWCVPKEHIITIYNMINVELTEPQFLIREDAREKLGLAKDAFVFGNLARLVKNKDHESLIKAFALIKPDCPNAKLVIMGVGDLADKLKQQVEDAGLVNDVLFTGFLPGGLRYMKAFDCFVLSSTQEAFGLVLLEAMIARLPVIATRVNGIPEVVADADVLVMPKDVLNLAANMKKIYLLSAQERAELGDKAYEHAEKNFSVARGKEKFWAIIDS
jgi:glycosyltransferase involved in cell wall biosynthesis